MVHLTTRFTHPRLPLALVERGRLLGDLDAALAHRLTLLSAAAGWGKTTLLSAWASQQPRPVAWLSLDELDNDPARFWAAVIEALRTRVPASGAVALSMLHSPQPPPLPTVLTVLLNDLASAPEPAPVVLILDDYHVIEDPDIHDAMGFLIEHLPAHLHVVLAGRVDPDLPLARWRVGGLMAEIRTADLRFTTAEATSFFARALGDHLSPDDLRLLERRTEGWVAGLQLAALALRKRTDRPAFVRTFTGSHRYLLDYIQEEILQRQPPPVQRFLLQTAVLSRLNAQVCAALTGDGDVTSQGMLEWLERHNLFVVPLDEQRQWYRLHDLFREVLQARLQATEPDEAQAMHRRAAGWYAAQNEPREAIAHALAAADFTCAAGLIEGAAPHLWLSGEAQTVQAWIGALPDPVLRQHARLALDAALRLLESVHGAVTAVYTRAQAQAEQTMARVDALLQHRLEPTVESAGQDVPVLPDADVAVLQRRLRLLRVMIATRAVFTGGNVERIQPLAEEAAELARHEDMKWERIGLWIRFGLIEALQRQGALLIPELLEAKQETIAVEDRAATIGVMRMLAFAYLRAARLQMAEQECLEALALVDQIGVNSTSTAYFHYFLSCIYHASNRLEEASRAVHEVLRIAQSWQQVDLLVVGNLNVMGLALARADRAVAEEALNTAEALTQQERFALHAGPVGAARVYYWLATGNLQAAGEWAAQVMLTKETWNANRNAEVLLLIQVYLAQQQYAAACAILKRFSNELDRPGDTSTLIEGLSLRVVALYCDGRQQDALATTKRLLALTATEDNIRVFLDAGAPMQALLRRLQDEARTGQHGLPPAHIAFVARLLAAFAQEPQRRAQQEQGHDQPVRRVPLERSDAPIAPLTRREHEVLRLLAAGASNQEIAADLVISLATVKKHVSNLLAKLGVARRSQAIALAHAEGRRSESKVLPLVDL